MQNSEQSTDPTDFPAYPAYKPSDIEWLGDIPSHWDAPMLKRVVRIINGATPSTLTPAYWNGNINWITPNDLGKLDTPYIETGERSISQQGYDSCGTRLAPAGSVVMSTRAPIGHVAILTAEACVNQGCRLIIPGKMIDSGFLYHQLKAFRNDLASFGQGSTFMELSQRNLGAFYIALPPLPEQRAIAAYLDRKGAIARRYAHVARHIIDTLRELRQVEIHDAVTRGLNEDIPLKPSGVEWLGDIPAHWDVRRLRYVAKMRTSNVDKHVKLNESPVRLCNYVDVYHNERISADLDFMRATATDREIERFRLERGDVIITKDSETWNDIGVPALVEYTADDLVCGYHLALLRPFESVMTGAYLLRALQAPTVASQFHIQANGVTRYGLTQNAIKSVHIPVPPLAEQRAIAEYLDAKTAAIDAAIAHYERMAELVAEYWTVLVADAVTGRIDLRQEAAE